MPGPTDHLLVIERERRLDDPDGPDSKIAFEPPAGDQEPTSSTEPESSESETAVGADDPALPAEVTGRVVTFTPRGWRFYAGQETGRPAKLEDRHVISEKDGGADGAVFQLESPGRYVWVSGNAA